MPSIVYEIAELLECKINQLQERLTHPDAREKVLLFLRGRQLHTTYPSARSEVVRCDVLSPGDATNTHAYGGLYKITVQQHYYSRKRIHLLYPRLPLVVMRCGRFSSPNYYPMELLSATTAVNLVNNDEGGGLDGAVGGFDRLW
jgi:hypothetical protein